MESFFEFHEKLNIKKLIVVIILIILLILLILLAYYKISQPQNIIQHSTTHTIFADRTSSFSIELAKSYELALFNSNSSYVLEIQSPNNLKILISHINSLNNFSFEDIIKNDKTNYLKKFVNTSNISEIVESTKNEKKSYSYSFNYMDENLSEDFFLQVIWINTELGYYIIDIQYPESDSDNYINLSDEILSSFKLQN